MQKGKKQTDKKNVWEWLTKKDHKSEEHECCGGGGHCCGGCEEDHEK